MWPAVSLNLKIIIVFTVFIGLAWRTSPRSVKKQKWKKGDSEFFLCPTLVTRRKKHLSLFLYRAQNLPPLLFLPTNITLSTLLILAVCRKRVMNLVIDLAHCGVTVTQWLQHLSAKSEGLRFSSSWGLWIFSLSHARDEMKKNLYLLNVCHEN